jgi:TnpA family transposase
MNTEKEWIMRRKDSKNMQRAARASTKIYYTGKGCAIHSHTTDKIKYRCAQLKKDYFLRRRREAVIA